MRSCRNCGKQVPSNVKFCTSCGSSDIFDSDKQVSEYKRTCNECGKTWHSLSKRENEIFKGIKGVKNAQCCTMCDANARKESQAKLNTYENEIERLKKCPQCGSGNFKEELIVYDKK
jgi:ribosomal protein S27AE